MASSTEAENQIMKVIRTINETCMKGKGFDKITPLFREDFTIVQPGFAARARGRDICLRSYEDACSQMTFEKLDASDELIDVYGSTAVVSYRYDCVWKFQGKRFEDDGHEILVFAKNDKGWQVIWRTVIPGSREIETCPTEAAAQASEVASTSLKQECLRLMETTAVCQLTTIDSEGFPHTTAMNNLRDKDLYPNLVELYQHQDNAFVVYLSTSQQSNKMARMLANPKVSVYFCKADQLQGLMLGGTIEIISDQSLKNRVWQDGWTMYYPNGPEGPEYGVLRLVPTTAKGWCKNGPFELALGGAS